MKILVADDDESMRDLIEAVLASAGHEVVTAVDGAAAWTAFEREAPALIVLDWQMPGLSGIEVCERIRAVDKDRRVFILMATARGATDDLQRVLAAGADDYLSKPLTPEALKTRLAIAERRIAIDEALRRARWVSGFVETAIAVQHEVNNPLTALLGNIALLEATQMSPEETSQCLRTIAEQATRIGKVIRRLSSLRDPRSVEYIQGSRMVDLSGTGER
jgi:DNA-binding response OmpR family regulator